jgi:hypothetical protein
MHMMNIYFISVISSDFILTISYSDALYYKIKKRIIVVFCSTRRFPGYGREGKKFDANVHRQHIFGLHVANYMTSLKEENADQYAKQFSRFVKAGVQPSSV